MKAHIELNRQRQAVVGNRCQAAMAGCCFLGERTTSSTKLNTCVSLAGQAASLQNTLYPSPANHKPHSRTSCDSCSNLVILFQCWCIYAWFCLYVCPFSLTACQTSLIHWDSAPRWFSPGNIPLPFSSLPSPLPEQSSMALTTLASLCLTYRY